MRNITIIHPSRGREALAYDTMKKWLSKCKHPKLVDYWLSIEPDNLEAYKCFFHAEQIIVNNNRSVVDAINNCAKAINFDILVVISDDFECPLHWDDILLNAIGDKTDFVLKTYDTTQQWIVTLPIMDKVYFNQFNYVYYPEFKHMFCDTWLTHVADIEKKLIIRNDIVFPHVTGITNNDAINQRNNSTWGQGMQLYFDLVKNNYPNNYDLTQPNATAHINWLKKHIK